MSAVAFVLPKIPWGIHDGKTHSWGIQHHTETFRHSEVQSICNLVLHLGLWETLSQTHPSCPSASHDLHRPQVRPPPLSREERQTCGKVPMAEFLLDWSARCFCWVDGFELHGWIFDNFWKNYHHFKISVHIKLLHWEEMHVHPKVSTVSLRGTNSRDCRTQMQRS